MTSFFEILEKPQQLTILNAFCPIKEKDKFCRKIKLCQFKNNNNKKQKSLISKFWELSIAEVSLTEERTWIYSTLL